ncbi:MAG: Trp family transcriptional regulator [Patescibacteria group bacterium]
MPKVSRNPLSREMQQEMMRAFIQTLVKISDDALLRRFLDDLLSPTEKLMLSKRLMAAVLLQRGYSGGAVCTALKMSKTTVWLIQRELVKSGDGYRTVFERFFRESRGQRILDAIERFLDAITLPVKGSRSSMRRWKRAIHR